MAGGREGCYRPRSYVGASYADLLLSCWSCPAVPQILDMYVGTNYAGVLPTWQEAVQGPSHSPHSISDDGCGWLTGQQRGSFNLVCLDSTPFLVVGP